MELKIGICDDDVKWLSFLKEALEKYQFAKMIDLKTDTFLSGTELIKAYTEKNKYQVLLLDVEMPEISGIKTADIIRRTKDKDVIIVFISNFPEYVQESFSVHPYHFLQKPVTEADINKLFDEILEEIEDRHILYTIIGSDDTNYTINVRDILYIESTDAKNKILTFNFADHQIIGRDTLLKWESLLAEHNFMLCYKGILVNLAHIHYFTKNTIVLSNGKTIPVSRTYEKKLRQLFSNKIVSLQK